MPAEATAGGAGIERALLVQPHPPGRFDQDLLEEFAELARSAGAVVVGENSQRLQVMVAFVRNELSQRDTFQRRLRGRGEHRNRRH